MDIKDIPPTDIKIFLLGNNIALSSDDLLAIDNKSLASTDYDNVWKLMENDDTNYGKLQRSVYLKAQNASMGYGNIPDSIVEWMMAYNLFLKKVNITPYSKEEILKMDDSEIIRLSKMLGMKFNKRKHIINILKFLGKLKENPVCKLFDKAVYDAGIKWIWVIVKIGNIAARLHLHMDDDWDIVSSLLNFLDCDNLHSDYKSSHHFSYGNTEHDHIKVGEKMKNLTEIPKEFQWLDDFLRLRYDNFYYAE